MTLTSTADSLSIFKDGKLKPGIYKIQNIVAETFLDCEVHTRELCCRPANELGEDKGLWEIKPFGAGYTIQRVEPGRPEQFCASMTGLVNGSQLSVSAYPVAWRVEVVDEDIHRGFEYVRFYWGTAKMLWNIANGIGTKVHLWTDAVSYRWFMWKLILVKDEGKSTPPWPSSEAPGSSSLPQYDRYGTGQSSTHTQHAESECDDFGTIVTEVTTTLVTTRKRYRAEEA